MILGKRKKKKGGRYDQLQEITAHLHVQQSLTALASADKNPVCTLLLPPLSNFSCKAVKYNQLWHCRRLICQLISLAEGCINQKPVEKFRAVVKTH